MAYNVRNEDYTSHSNDQLENRSRQEHLRTQRHINTGHGIREQACNGIQRSWIYLQAHLASALLVGAVSLGAMIVTGLTVEFIGGSCNGMRYRQWWVDEPVNWDKDKIRTWNAKCRGAIPSSPGNGGKYWLWTSMGLCALCAWSFDTQLAREAGFKH